MLVCVESGSLGGLDRLLEDSLPFQVEFKRGALFHQVDLFESSFHSARVQEFGQCGAAKDDRGRVSVRN